MWGSKGWNRLSMEIKVMNGTVKFHKANGPSFNPGEIWTANGGKISAKIVSVRKFGAGKWDYEVTYQYPTGELHSKDAWNFQVRYQHQADNFIKENRFR